MTVITTYEIASYIMGNAIKQNRIEVWELEEVFEYCILFFTARGIGGMWQ